MNDDEHSRRTSSLSRALKPAAPDSGARFSLAALSVLAHSAILFPILRPLDPDRILGSNVFLTRASLDNQSVQRLPLLHS